MATVTELYTGTATIGTTEYSLTNSSTTIAAKTDDGPIQVWLELHNLAAGDEYELRVYEKVLSSSTQRLVYRQYFRHAQTEPVAVTPSLLVTHGWDVTLARLAGSDRSISWSIRTV